jgi:hypothetical protein
VLDTQIAKAICVSTASIQSAFGYSYTWLHDYGQGFAPTPVVIIRRFFGVFFGLKKCKWVIDKIGIKK